MIVSDINRGLFILQPQVTNPNDAPVVNITSPGDGSTSTVGDSVSFAGTANDTEDGDLTAGLSWSSSIDGVIGSGGSFSTSALSIGSHNIIAQVTDSGGRTGSDAISINVLSTGGGPQIALYNGGLGVPACLAAGSSCDSVALLDGRANLGPEPNQPNTLDSCTDGTSGSYHSDESNDQIVVSTLDAADMVEGATVQVDATVYAWSTGTSDHLDLYYAADANSPSWQLITTIDLSSGGLQTLSAQYTLPAGSLQAVRANFRYNGSPSSCSSGNYDDADDLVFAVGTASVCTINDDCDDDGNFCNGDEVCNVGTGQCVSEGNPCGDDGTFCNGVESCDEGADQCTSSGDPCGDDGQFCTGVESCDEGADQCVASGDPCGDDGQFCTGVESCDEGADQCVASGDPCGDDGQFCNGVESCDEGADQCVASGDPCGDDGQFCTGVESCDEGADQCVASGDPCGDDGQFCNGAESCDEGGDQCVSSGDPCPPGDICDEGTDTCEPPDLCTGVDCDDGNVCTDDACNPGTGLCEYTDNTAACDDGAFCTVGDVCSGGSCTAGAGNPCGDDGQFCNGTESCDEVGDQCVSSGDPCLPGEICDEGTDTCDQPPAGAVLYMSFRSSTALPGAGTVQDEDVASYDEGSGTWALVFDGSDVGLGAAEIDGLAILPGGDLLLSFRAPIAVGGLDTDDSDVVRFTGTGGANTSGTFSMYFDGSAFGLTSNGEDVDAITLDAGGDLVVSTQGGFSGTGASGADEDLFLFDGSSFSQLFDGSDVELGGNSAHDVDAATFTAGGNLLFSTSGNISVTGVTGADEDIVEFTGTFGSSTSGTFSMYLDLSALGIISNEDVGSLHIED